jgi:hypothetical protein
MFPFTLKKKDPAGILENGMKMILKHKIYMRNLKDTRFH